MIVISTDFVVPTTGDYNANSPLVGYHNLVDVDTISADLEEASYPASNLANPATFLEWQSTGNIEQYLTIDTSAYGDEIDYLAVARHNFGTAGCVVSVEGDDGSGYDEIVQETLLADDSPVLFQWEPGIYNSVRLRMQAGSENPRAAVVYVGKLLKLQRRIYVGHTPINYGRSAMVVTGQSESGNFLGRIVLGESVATSVALQNLTSSWYREQLDPFIINSKTLPFFFAWRPSTYPKEVGFAWMTNEPKPSNQRNNGMMQISLEMAGISS